MSLCCTPSGFLIFLDGIKICSKRVKAHSFFFQKQSEYGATSLSKKLVGGKADNNAAKRLTAIYSGRVRKDMMKPRKRSASTSPVRRRSRKLPRKHFFC